MAKNFAGLGMSFFSVDKGAQKSIQQMCGALSCANDELDTLDKEGTAAFKNLKSAIQNLNPKERVGKITTSLKGLTGAMTTHKGMSSSLESTYVQASKSAGMLAQQTGIAASSIKKNTSFFHGLNMDVDDLQKGYVNLETSGIDVSKIGFNNFKEFAKFSSVLGTNTDTLSKDLHGLRQSYGFADEDLQSFIESNSVAAQKLGVAGAVFQNMSTITANLDEHFAKLNLDASPEQYNKLANSVVLLSGAYRQAGGSIEDSTGFATGLSSQLTDVQFTMSQLSSGATGELPDLLKNLGMSMGDFGDASEALSNDPLKFVQFMSSKFGKMDAGQKKFFQNWSVEKLGKDLTWMIANYGKVADKVDGAATAMGNAGGAAHGIAKAYNDGRTAQERWDLANEVFQDRMFNLARQSGVVKDVLGGQASAHKKMGDLVSDQIKKGGVWGSAAQALVVYNKMGLMPALLVTGKMITKMPIVSNMMEKFGDNISGVKNAFKDLADGGGFRDFAKNMKKEMSGAMDKVPGADKALKGAGLALKGAAVGKLALASGPLAPYVAAIGGLAILQTEYEGGISGLIDNSLSFISTELPRLSQGLADDLELGFMILVDQDLPLMLESLGDRDLASSLGTFSEAMGGALGGMMEKSGDALSEVDIGTMLGNAIWDGLYYGIDFVSDLYVGALSSLLGLPKSEKEGAAVKIGRGIWGVFKSAIQVPFKLIKTLHNKMSSALLNLFLPEGFKVDAHELYGDVLDDMLGGIKGFLSEGAVAVSGFKDEFMAVWEDIGGGASGIWDGMKDGAVTALGVISLGFKALKHLAIHEIFGPMLRTVEDFVLAPLTILKKAAGTELGSTLMGSTMSAELVDMNLDKFKVSTALGYTEEGRSASIKELSSDWNALSEGGGSTGGKAGEDPSTSILKQIHSELKKQNDPAGLTPKSPRVTDN